MDISARTDGANALMFGLDGSDTIVGNRGNDFLYGGDDNDFLTGGGGNDELWGGALDESGRADGTDTARYDSASAGIVVNLNGGFGAPITVQDGQGGTDTLHSIEIIKGSSHSDTLVLTDLTPEIASDLDYIDLGAGEDTVDVSALSGTFRFDGSNPSDQTLTDGVSVLHLRNVEHIEGNHDTLILGSSDGVRVDGGAALVAAAGSLFTYADFETIQCGDGNDRVFGGDSGHYIAGGGVNYLEGSGTAVLESTTGDTYFSVSDGGTVISGAGNDYIEVTGDAPVTIEFGVGSGHDMLDSYFNGFEDGETRLDMIVLEGLTLDDIELVWDFQSDEYVNEWGWDTDNDGISDRTYEFDWHGRWGQAAIRIKSTGDTLYLGDIYYAHMDYQAEYELWVGNLYTHDIERHNARSAYNIANNIGPEPNTGDEWNYVASNADDRDVWTVDADIFSFDGINRLSFFDLFDFRNVTAQELPSDVTAASDVLERIGQGSGSGFSGGSSAADNLTGGSASDDVMGGAGDDSLDGGGGNDVLRGGDGADTLTGGEGDDGIDGGSGIDTASYASASAAISINLALNAPQNTGGAGSDTLSNIENLVGTEFNDTLTGSAAANRIDGGEGNDLIDGAAGNDTLIGGAGLDTVSYASASAAVMVSLATTAVQDTVGAGYDTLSGFENLIGSSFADTLTGDANGNRLTGGNGDDVLSGGAGGDTLEGGAGNDSIDGGADRDVVSYAGATAGVTVDLAVSTAQNTGGAGTDTIVNVESINGSAFDDVLLGNADNNNIKGQGGNDILDGRDGNDVLEGGDGNDTQIAGGNGSDTASYASATTGVHVYLGTVGAQDTVGAGTDTITGCERLTGSAFADTLIGATDANIIVAGDGDDILRGLGGSDTLTGGNGADVFLFDTALNASTNVDTITDFASGSDRIKLASAIFTSAGPAGTLAASAFQLGTAADDAQDHIIYDSSTGNIYYDADGNGVGAQVLFAQVTAGLTLTNSDFYIG
jgi:Ca2+-binding RTX toxin-like protein